jgi:phosphatidylglycerophosphatase A
MNKLTYYFVTFFGLGKKLPAPGTFGSLVGMVIWMILDFFSLLSSNFEIILFFSFLVFWASSYACSTYIRRSFNKDPSEIIIDEILSQFLALFIGINILQNLFFENYWLNILLYFLLFRFFDIKKPFFIKKIEKKFKGGFGIMIDDIVATIYVIILSTLSIILHT